MDGIKRLFGILQTIMVLCGCFPVYAASLSETIIRIKPSVVAVGTVLPTRRPPNLFIGTGFVVSDGSYVVTNAHVLPEKIDTTKKEKLAIFAGRGGDVSIRYAIVLKTDYEHDIALLKISGTPLPAFKLGPDKLATEGKTYAFTGFPLGTVIGLYPVTHRGIISAITPIAMPAMTSGKLTPKLIRRMKNPYEVLQMDAVAYPGNSGSPVYDPETGVVVGIVNKVLVKESKEHAITDPSGITYAIPVKYIRDLLGK